MSDEQLTIDQCAEVAGVHVGTVYRWVHEGCQPQGIRSGPKARRVKLIATQVDGRYYVRRDVFELYRAEVVSRGRANRAVAAGALAREYWHGAKLGAVSVTYAARQTCPGSCRFADAGCYAEADNTAMVWRRVTDGAAGKTPAELARAEADAIAALSGRRPLRLHVAGDAATASAAAVLAEAAALYRQKHGQPVWTYTHAWRDVPRRFWGGVSVLASCETPADVRDAHAAGYAAAMVVREFERESAYDIGGGKLLPCPAMTRDVVCSNCRICFDATRLHDRRLVIGFSTHGSGKKHADAALKRIPLALVA